MFSCRCNCHRKVVQSHLPHVTQKRNYVFSQLLFSSSYPLSHFTSAWRVFSYIGLTLKNLFLDVKLMYVFSLMVVLISSLWCPHTCSKNKELNVTLVCKTFQFFFKFTKLLFPITTDCSICHYFLMRVSDEIAWKKPDRMTWIGIRAVYTTEKSSQNVTREIVLVFF